MEVWGFTGIIINATMKLVKIKSSYIDQTTIKTKNLKETLVFSKNMLTRHIPWRGLMVLLRVQTSENL